MSLGWRNTETITRENWICGYCGHEVAGDIGFRRELSDDDGRKVYICPYCENPTAFIYDGLGYPEQFPKPVMGNEVEGLPESVESVYNEARRCIQCAAYTSATLALRKLLMHVAVEQGAEPGKSFVSYVAYLDENGWIPPNGKEWVDTLRTMGNEAAHEIRLVGEDDALELLSFAELLLKFVYEFPSRVRKK